MEHIDNYVKVSVTGRDNSPRPADGPPLVSWREFRDADAPARQITESYVWPFISADKTALTEAFDAAVSFMRGLDPELDARISIWNPAAIARHRLITADRIGNFRKEELVS